MDQGSNPGPDTYQSQEKQAHPIRKYKQYIPNTSWFMWNLQAPTSNVRKSGLRKQSQLEITWTLVICLLKLQQSESRLFVTLCRNWNVTSAGNYNLHIYHTQQITLFELCASKYIGSIPTPHEHLKVRMSCIAVYTLPLCKEVWFVKRLSLLTN